MSILEILEAHDYRIIEEQIKGHGKVKTIVCNCGDRYGFFETHRKHVAQVLEQHEREAKAAVLEEAADEIERLENIGDTAQGELNEEQTAEYWLYHGTPKTTWLRDRAAELKETP